MSNTICIERILSIIRHKYIYIQRKISRIGHMTWIRIYKHIQNNLIPKKVRECLRIKLEDVFDTKAWSSVSRIGHMTWIRMYKHIQHCLSRNIYTFALVINSIYKHPIHCLIMLILLDLRITCCLCHNYQRQTWAYCSGYHANVSFFLSPSQYITNSLPHFVFPPTRLQYSPPLVWPLRSSPPLWKTLRSQLNWLRGFLPTICTPQRYFYMCIEYRATCRISYRISMLLPSCISDLHMIYTCLFLIALFMIFNIMLLVVLKCTLRVDVSCFCGDDPYK